MLVSADFQKHAETLQDDKASKQCFPSDMYWRRPSSVELTACRDEHNNARATIRIVTYRSPAYIPVVENLFPAYRRIINSLLDHRIAQLLPGPCREG